MTALITKPFSDLQHIDGWTSLDQTTKKFIREITEKLVFLPAKIDNYTYIFGIGFFELRFTDPALGVVYFSPQTRSIFHLPPPGTTSETKDSSDQTRLFEALREYMAANNWPGDIIKINDFNKNDEITSKLVEIIKDQTLNVSELELAPDYTHDINKAWTHYRYLARITHNKLMVLNNRTSEEHKLNCIPPENSPSSKIINETDKEKLQNDLKNLNQIVSDLKQAQQFGITHVHISDPTSFEKTSQEIHQCLEGLKPKPVQSKFKKCCMTICKKILPAMCVSFVINKSLTFASTAALVTCGLTSSPLAMIGLGCIVGGTTSVIIGKIFKDKHRQRTKHQRLKDFAFGCLGGVIGGAIAYWSDLASLTGTAVIPPAPAAILPTPVAPSPELFAYDMEPVAQTTESINSFTPLPESLIPDTSPPTEFLTPPYVLDQTVLFLSPADQGLTPLLTPDVFKNLPSHVQHLGQSQNPRDLVNFSLQAAHELMNSGQPYTTENVLTARTLLEHAITLGHENGITGKIMEKVHANLAYLQSLNPDGNVRTALDTCQAGGNAVKNFCGRLTAMFGPRLGLH